MSHSAFPHTLPPNCLHPPDRCRTHSARASSAGGPRGRRRRRAGRRSRRWRRMTRGGSRPSGGWRHAQGWKAKGLSSPKGGMEAPGRVAAERSRIKRRNGERGGAGGGNKAEWSEGRAGGARAGGERGPATHLLHVTLQPLDACSSSSSSRIIPEACTRLGPGLRVQPPICDEKRGWTSGDRQMASPWNPQPPTLNLQLPTDLVQHPLGEVDPHHPAVGPHRLGRPQRHEPRPAAQVQDRVPGGRRLMVGGWRFHVAV